MQFETFDHANRERWHLTEIAADKIRSFSEKFNIHPILARLIIARQIGVTNGQLDESQIQRFIYPERSLITETVGVTSNEDLQKALTRIAQALQNNEPIMVNGDPDADGITGTTILTASLREFGATVHYDFPTRAKEGHGLQPRIIEATKALGSKLIITTDCGSKDVEAVNYANTLGIDIIICDHHILGKVQPAAHAFVNPYRYDGPSGCKRLAGAGVSYKLVLALSKHLNHKLPDELNDFLLAIAALGTISDRMSFLEPMNRIMIKAGIDALNKTKMEGLKALKAVSIPRGQDLRANDISRTIVPRLNAPGRIGDREEGIPDSRIVVDLLLIGFGKKNAAKAHALVEQFNQVVELEQQQKNNTPALNDAQTVDDINEKRKYMTSKIEDEIDKMIQEQVNPNTDRIIIVKGRNWNPGVIGIDTDRLKDRFLRPAMILTEYTGSDYIRGSVRSIPGINMYRIIDLVGEQFEKQFGKQLFLSEVKSDSGKRLVNAFGGHSQACGFTFHKDHLDAFVGLVREEMKTVPIDKFNYSYEVLDTIDFDEINMGLIHILDGLTPYGQDFEYPIFYLKNCLLTKARPFGNKYQESRTPHVDFWVVEKKPKRNRPPMRVNAVGFGLWEKFNALKTNDTNASYNIIFTVEYSRRTNRRQKDRLRLNVLDIRKSGSNDDHIVPVTFS
ncbi:MAG: DHH family phosphoesterase [Candidatus Margulisiibacteriota bacterium]